MAFQFTNSYVEDALSLLRYYKALAERAIDPLSDEQLVMAIDAESNSIAIIVKHLAGNMVSRWTGFPGTDGEKPDRDRDAEFVDPPKTRGELMRLWNDGWVCVFEAMEQLPDRDLGMSVMIRGEAHSAMQAINRQVAHYAYHCGQIVFLAKHLNHAGWKALTIPRGKSEEFNRRVAAGEVSQR